jgi:hypothetical protein
VPWGRPPDRAAARDQPLHSRLARVLEQAVGRPARADTYGRPVAPTAAATSVGANAYLRVMSDRPEVEFALYPADTLTQAKVFYREHDALAGVRHLRAHSSWRVTPNFHFGHFQRGYCWTCNERDLDEYVQLWVNRIEHEAAVPREDWNRYWSWLERERIACSSDLAEFDRYFVHSNRPVAVPRPGLALSRRWPLQEAQARGGEHDLGEEVRQLLDEALHSFGGASS